MMMAMVMIIMTLRRIMIAVKKSCYCPPLIKLSTDAMKTHLYKYFHLVNVNTWPAENPELL